MRTILSYKSTAAMYVCICNGITDRDIRTAVAQGARSLADLQSSLGVATCCGRCADCAHGIVREACVDAAPCNAGGDD
jgi:bacterioferritin-associated ferredoxin